MISYEAKKMFKEHITNYQQTEYQIDAIPINKKYVHKKLNKNIAITKPVMLCREGPIYRTRIIVANENDFFFDHDLRHLPGMLMMEAARQLSITVTHIHYSIPFSDRFLMNEIESRFFRLSNKVDPTYLDLIINRALIKDMKIHYMRGTCYIHQNSLLNGIISGSWTTITREIFSKLEEKIKREKYPRGVMVNVVP